MNVCIRATFTEFASKWGRDPRFRAVEKMRERESLFSEYILEVRRQEETESQGKIERVSNLIDWLLSACINCYHLFVHWFVQYVVENGSIDCS